MQYALNAHTNAVQSSKQNYRVAMRKQPYTYTKIYSKPTHTPGCLCNAEQLARNSAAKLRARGALSRAMYLVIPVKSSSAAALQHCICTA
jgi:hypothetical protein